MNKKLFLGFVGGLFILLFFNACNYSNHPGYSKTFSGLHYKIVYLGDGEVKPKTGDKILYRITLKTLTDSVLYHNAHSAHLSNNFEVYQPTSKGGINEALALMHEGDSAVFIVNKKNLAFERQALSKYIPNNILEVVIEIKLQKLLAPHLFDIYEKKQKWKEDDEMNEQIKLSKFLVENNITADNYLSGIYFVEHKKGLGAYPQNGQTLFIHYKAGFLDGRFLDDSYFLGRPLEVRLGDPDQLLPGFDIGIRNVKKGGHATFIIPSQLAFGENGSSNNTVKPFETVIYEVELLDIK